MIINKYFFLNFFYLKYKLYSGFFTLKVLSYNFNYLNILKNFLNKFYCNFFYIKKNIFKKYFFKESISSHNGFFYFIFYYNLQNFYINFLNILKNNKNLLINNFVFNSHFIKKIFFKNFVNLKCKLDVYFLLINLIKNYINFLKEKFLFIYKLKFNF